jgi:hypothetical protein
MSRKTNHTDWESQVEAYLMGEADADALDARQRQIDLPGDARREIADALSLIGALDQLQDLPVPQGLGEQLEQAVQREAQQPADEATDESDAPAPLRFVDGPLGSTYPNPDVRAAGRDKPEDD